MPNFGSEPLLLVISQAAGLVLLIGTMLLVGFRRIYFDSKTKRLTEVQLPIFGKIKTQAPAIVLIFVGAFLVVYPLTRARPDMATVVGEVDTGNRPVTVRIVAIPQFQTTLQKSGKYHLPVPLLKDNLYRVEYIVDDVIIADQEVMLEQNEFHPVFVGWQPPSTTNSNLFSTKTTTTIVPKEVSDEDLKRAGIPVTP